MQPDLSPGHRGQRAFSASEASLQRNNPPERQGWALKHEGARWRILCTVCMRPGPSPSEPRTGGSAPAIHPKCRIHKSQFMRHPVIVSFPPTRDHLDGVARLIVNPSLLCCCERFLPTEAPSLHRHYPLSAVLWTSPRPHTARPGSPEVPIDPLQAITAGASRVASDLPCLHAVAITRAGPGELVRSYCPPNFDLPRPEGESAPALNCFEACSAFTHVTACRLAESPMRPFPSEASAASLPPAPPRLLPGGTNQFPGGIFTRLRPAPSTAHNELPFIPVLTETPHPPEGSGRPLPSERLRIRAGERAAKPGVVPTANSGCHFPAPSPCDPKPSGDGARVRRAVSGIRGQVSGFRRQESETPSCSGLAFWPPRPATPSRLPLGSKAARGRCRAEGWATGRAAGGAAGRWFPRQYLASSIGGFRKQPELPGGREENGNFATVSHSRGGPGTRPWLRHGAPTIGQRGQQLQRKAAASPCVFRLLSEWPLRDISCPWVGRLQAVVAARQPGKCSAKEGSAFHLALQRQGCVPATARIRQNDRT